MLSPGCFVLVVKVDNTNNGSYKIRRTSTTNEYILTGKSDQPFENLAELIDFYKTNDGLVTLLQKPVLRIREEQRERDKWEIDKR